jgi:hypothetical protein
MQLTVNFNTQTLPSAPQPVPSTYVTADAVPRSASARLVAIAIVLTTILM